MKQADTILTGAILALGLGVLAQAQAESTAQPAHGEFAAAIRSAGQPCNHVIGVSSIRERVWSVQCNAGSYTLERDDSGRLVLKTVG